MHNFAVKKIFSKMQTDNLQYYMVVDEKSTGPFTLEEVINHPALTPETLVWKPGLDNWMAAKTFPELSVTLSPNEPTDFQTPPDYANSNPGYNPHQTNHNRNQDSDPQNNQAQNPFANNPQYRENHSYRNNNPYNNNGYGNHNHYGYHDRYDERNRYYDPHDPHDPRNQYQNGYRPNFRTNWLPWAIVATVLGFFTSCIGAIFGIIGIVQANKANTFYSQGYEREGDAANSNARIMTIIGLVFAALGIIAAVWFGSFFSSLGNISYF